MPIFVTALSVTVSASVLSQAPVATHTGHMPCMMQNSPITCRCSNLPLARASFWGVCVCFIANCCASVSNAFTQVSKQEQVPLNAEALAMLNEEKSGDKRPKTETGSESAYTLGPPLRILHVKNMGRILAPERLRICPWAHGGHGAR